MLHQIIYTSAALPSVTLHDFEDITRHASQNNRVLDVTGILLFSDGVVFQVLEGEKDVVQALYDRIKDDQRHSSVVLMISREAAAREFPDWSMGSTKMSPNHVSELGFLLTKDSLSEALPPEPTTELRVLSQTFARVNGL